MKTTMQQDKKVSIYTVTLTTVSGTEQDLVLSDLSGADAFGSAQSASYGGTYQLEDNMTTQGTIVLDLEELLGDDYLGILSRNSGLLTIKASK